MSIKRLCRERLSTLSWWLFSLLKPNDLSCDDDPSAHLPAIDRENQLNYKKKKKTSPDSAQWNVDQTRPGRDRIDRFARQKLTRVRWIDRSLSPISSTLAQMIHVTRTVRFIRAMIAGSPFPSHQELPSMLPDVSDRTPTEYALCRGCALSYETFCSGGIWT